ncbi:hypothetical protein AB0O75_45170 [Streptomyces sp. NPDC088921]|uniref:hypothetical protein n=1 Tax=unclassified Streptomyces TaxID=2593676 RepID=UPI00342A4405
MTGYAGLSAAKKGSKDRTSGRNLGNAGRLPLPESPRAWGVIAGQHHERTLATTRDRHLGDLFTGIGMT